MVNIETLENKVKKLNAELEHFRNIESNEKSINEMKECIEEMEEQVEICEELVDEFEPRIETLEKSEVVIKEDIKTINDKINTTNEKVTTLDSEVKSVNDKVNNIEGYNDSEIKKDLGEQKTQLKQASLDIKKLDKQKADKEHKHVIDDIEGLPAFLEDIKNKPNGPVAVGGYTKGVRSIVAGTGITIDETDPRHPIINSTGGGGSSSLEVTQNAHGFVDLDWLYYDSSDSTFKKAQADSISTLGSWHVVEVVDANTFKVAKDGTHTITNALALGEYVLSDATAGGYTQTVPGDLGEYVLYGMEVISGTEVSFYTSTAVEVGVEVEGNGTANQITYWTDSSTLGALDTATYPSLTELTYVKGVTSAIQTQLDGKITASSSDVLTNKTLTAPKFADLGFIADANGNELIVMDTVASAVNEITISNAATGNRPTIAATGDDANIDINITPKGSGFLRYNGINVLSGTNSVTGITNKTFTAPRITTASHIADANGNELIAFPSAVASAVNEITISNAATGAGPTLSATGGDTNIDLNLQAKGTGKINANSTILLAENTSLELDGSLSADGKWSGTTITGTAGYTQAFGDLVYLDPTDSRREACDANAASGADGDCRGLIGMVVSTGTDGTACTILLNGTIRADANFPTLTVGGPVFASETAGDVVTTAPATSGAVVRVLGSALTADSMYFNPSGDFIVNV